MEDSMMDDRRTIFDGGSFTATPIATIDFGPFMTRWYDLTYEQVLRVEAMEDSEQTEEDRVYRVYAHEITYTDYQVTVSWSGSDEDLPPYTVTSLDTDVLSDPDSNGRMTALKTGT